MSPSTPSHILPCRNLVGLRLDSDRLEFVSVLGEGAYGVVYRALDLSSDPRQPVYYAVKVLSNVALSPRQRKFQQREHTLHTLLSPHPSVLTLHKTLITPTHTFLVMDLLPSGDLFSLITDGQAYVGRDDLVSSVFDQLCAGVEWAHEIGIYHRDLKPENLFCDGIERVVLGDWGLATTEKRSSSFGCGSTFYLSPECHNLNPHPTATYSPQKNDVWSLGIILINLCCQRNPWKVASPTDPTFAAYLANPMRFLQEILPLTDEAMTVLTRCLDVDESRRCTVGELRKLASGVRRWSTSEEERLEQLALKEQEARRLAKVESEARREAERRYRQSFSHGQQQQQHHPYSQQPLPHTFLGSVGTRPPRNSRIFLPRQLLIPPFEPHTSPPRPPRMSHARVRHSSTTAPSMPAPSTMLPPVPPLQSTAYLSHEPTEFSPSPSSWSSSSSFSDSRSSTLMPATPCTPSHMPESFIPQTTTPSHTPHPYATTTGRHVVLNDETDQLDFSCFSSVSSCSWSSACSDPTPPTPERRPSIDSHRPSLTAFFTGSTSTTTPTSPSDLPPLASVKNRKPRGWKAVSASLVDVFGSRA